VSFVGAISAEQIFDRISRKCAEFVAGVGREFRVKRQNLDGKGRFVDDSLSRSVTTRKQFEVFISVIRSNAVNVMDGLISSQFSSKTLFHDIPVFVDVFLASSVDVRVSKHDVAAKQSSGYGAFGAWTGTLVGFNKSLLLKRASTRIAASHGSPQTVTFSREFGSAHLARSCFDACSTFVRARTRAVLRIFTPVFSVGAQAANCERERFFAFGAMKLDGFGDVLRATFGGQIRKIALSTAKFVRFSCSHDRELFRAVNAVSYQHRYLLLSVGGLYANTLTGATLNFVGVP
jgi:hypothetical protein